VQVRIFLLPVTPMRAVSGRFRPMRTGFLLGLASVGHLRRPILFSGEERVPVMRDERFRKNSDYLLKHLLVFIFCKL
jgi:hypothetical protein